MSRGIYPRVNFFDTVHVLALVFFAVTVIEGDKHSCYEVRAAFQQRQVGPLQLVPEKPYTGKAGGGKKSASAGQHKA